MMKLQMEPRKLSSWKKEVHMVIKGYQPWIAAEMIRNIAKDSHSAGELSTANRDRAEKWADVVRMKKTSFIK